MSRAILVGIMKWSNTSWHPPDDIDLHFGRNDTVSEGTATVSIETIEFRLVRHGNLMLNSCILMTSSVEYNIRAKPSRTMPSKFCMTDRFWRSIVSSVAGVPLSRMTLVRFSVVRASVGRVIVRRVLRSVGRLAILLLMMAMRLFWLCSS